MLALATNLIGGTILLAVGSLFGVLGAGMLVRSYKRVTRGRAATGTVVGWKERTGRHTTYSPEVEFATPRGLKVVFTASYGIGVKPKLGRKVKVLYFPDAPNDADVASFVSLWFFPFLLLAFALATWAITIGVWTGFLASPTRH